MQQLREVAPRIVPLLDETSKVVEHAVRDGKRVLFEGAQGTLLDIDHGTYPFVTSSHATAGGACTGTGVGPSRIDFVVGLVKAYCTRVGGGPFPTELTDEIGERLRKRGDEFGSVTGRPRRTGWLDLPALRYAVRVNGLDGLALTKLDVLTGLDEIKVCTAYRTAAGTSPDFPIDDAAHAVPVYESLPGWSADLSSARSLAALPETARRYVERIEREAGCPVVLVSVGIPARRDHRAPRTPSPPRLKAAVQPSAAAATSDRWTVRGGRLRRRDLGPARRGGHFEDQICDPRGVVVHRHVARRPRGRPIRRSARDAASAPSSPCIGRRRSSLPHTIRIGPAAASMRPGSGSSGRRRSTSWKASHRCGARMRKLACSARQLSGTRDDLAKGERAARCRSGRGRARAARRTGPVGPSA